MYHYDTCGMSNVYLLNGFEKIETAEGPAVSIHDVDGLHQAIAEALVAMPRRLNGEGFRFLRIELDMSQKSLGAWLGKTDQSIAKWEKGEQPIPKMADVIVRQLYMESVSKDSKVGGLIEIQNKLDRTKQQHELRFSESKHGWTPVAGRNKSLADSARHAPC